jgi:NTE family protein
VKLFICASNVMTGRHRVFRETEVSVDAVLASACLPFMFQAVQVDGEHYWDGGYMGNPPLYPLFYHTDTPDVLIVQINPINIRELPTTAQAILDRINTLSFNSSLMREMRAINFVTKLIDRGIDDGGRLKRVNIHTIDAEDHVEAQRRLGVPERPPCGGAREGVRVHPRPLRQDRRVLVDRHRDEIPLTRGDAP